RIRMTFFLTLSVYFRFIGLTQTFWPLTRLAQLPLDQLAQIKAEFIAELESLQTEQGIWDDLTTLYILGRKPENRGL
ncbi:hypothetical protein ACSYAD_34285, partial [Acaryochloris marina NIES-2412]